MWVEFSLFLFTQEVVHTHAFLHASSLAKGYEPLLSPNPWLAKMYIFQAKYIRNKKINENKLVGGTKTLGYHMGVLSTGTCGSG
jgi:hypothetical protein